MENDLRRVTLKDIAERTGYSLTSIHRAMTHKAGVSDAVRDEILTAAHNMGYTTNYVASALKRKQVTIGIVLPESEVYGKYYFAYFWKGIHDYAAEVNGYNISLLEFPFSCNNENESEHQLAKLNELWQDPELRLDGLLTAPVENSPALEEAINRFIERGTQVVLIDNDFPNIGRLCCIAPNDRNTGRLSAELMSGLLPRQEGLVLVAAGDRSSLSHHMNLEGFEGYLRQNAPWLRVLAVHDAGDGSSCQKRLAEVLREHPEIVAGYSVRARNTIPLCRAAEESGRLGQLCLLGSDLFPESAEMLRRGVLRGIVYKNPYQKGYLAVKALFESLIKGRAPKSSAIHVTISVILRSNLVFFEEFL